MQQRSLVLNPVYLFDLAARHTRWAAARQATIAGNIANANTPGYKALDIEPFAEVLDADAADHGTRPQPAHLGGADADAVRPQGRQRARAGTSPTPATPSASSRN